MKMSEMINSIFKLKRQKFAMETLNEKIIIKPENAQGERFVFLELPNERYKPVRCIGYLKDRTFFTTRKADVHKFRKLNSIGINYKLLNEGGAYFDFIVIEYNFQLLQTTRKYFLGKGKFLHFKNNGLDKQVFLRPECFGLDTAEKWERNKPLKNNPPKIKQGALNFA